MLGARDDQWGKWRRRGVQKGGFRLSPKNWPVDYQPSWVLSAQIRKHRSLRLVAQDIALSRRVHEFESRRERQFECQCRWMARIFMLNDQRTEPARSPVRGRRPSSSRKRWQGGPHRAAARGAEQSPRERQPTWLDREKRHLCPPDNPLAGFQCMMPIRTIESVGESQHGC